MKNEPTNSALYEKLGIRVLFKKLIAEPDYVRIAVRWHEKYEKTGSNDAYLAFRHFLRVAEELHQAEVFDDFTQEVPCPSPTP